MKFVLGIIFTVLSIIVLQMPLCAMDHNNQLSSMFSNDMKDVRYKHIYPFLFMKDYRCLSCVNKALNVEFGHGLSYKSINLFDLQKQVREAWSLYGENGVAKTVQLCFMDISSSGGRCQLKKEKYIHEWIDEVVKKKWWANGIYNFIGTEAAVWSDSYYNYIELIGAVDARKICIDGRDERPSLKHNKTIEDCKPIIKIYCFDQYDAPVKLYDLMCDEIPLIIMIDNGLHHYFAHLQESLVRVSNEKRDLSLLSSVAHCLEKINTKNKEYGHRQTNVIPDHRMCAIQ